MTLHHRPTSPCGRHLGSLAAGCIAILVAVATSPVLKTTTAAPPASKSPAKRFFESLTKRPEPPKAFIPAPTPPPLVAEPGEPSPEGGSKKSKTAAERLASVPPATVGTGSAPGKAVPAGVASAKISRPPSRPPNWQEMVAFAGSLRAAAEKVSAAATDPSYAAKIPARAAVPPEATAKSKQSPPRVAAAQTKVHGKASGPQPPQTRRFQRLQALIAQTLDTYQRRPLNTAHHSPWEVMHGFIAFGIPTKIRVGGPSGDLVNSIGWMNMGGRCHGQVMLAAVDDRLVAMKGIGVQGHSAQYLAILAQCRVAVNSPITIQSKSFTVADLVKEEQLSCKSNTELTFALIGLAHYLPSDSTWTARDGKQWSLEKLVAEELEQPIRGAPCGGTHRLYGLSYGCQRRLKAAGRLDGHYARADRFVRDYQQFTLTKLRNTDGSFSTEWFKYPADRDDDIDRKIQTTGHILEWLVGSVDQELLYDPRIVAAAEFLARSLVREPSREWKIGPMGHALHALTIYQERAWGVVLPGSIAAYHGQMKAAPDTARIADAPEAAGTPKSSRR